MPRGRWLSIINGNMTKDCTQNKHVYPGMSSRTALCMLGAASESSESDRLDTALPFLVLAGWVGVRETPLQL